MNGTNNLTLQQNRVKAKQREDTYKTRGPQCPNLVSIQTKKFFNICNIRGEFLVTQRI